MPTQKKSTSTTSTTSTVKKPSTKKSVKKKPDLKQDAPIESADKNEVAPEPKLKTSISAPKKVAVKKVQEAPVTKTPVLKDIATPKKRRKSVADPSTRQGNRRRG